ncbi:porin [Paraburkholderia sp. BL27I4N3]|uniref:porin n=1 Tax=Paraburkholderia sp. BL27I4N3 TaxID=1938805 RepID=UPI000E283E1B|nr:porin [Paraburkholderia sp. BL27I4N3]
MLAALCVAAPAYAQSSVTLYGIIDEGLMYVSNARVTSNGATHSGRIIGLSSGVLSGSRWGLRGAEDLGGKLQAIFVIENGYDPSTGKLNQGGLMFGRQAYVGLSSQTFGSVTLGRQYDASPDMVGYLAAGSQWAGYIGAHPGDLDNFNNSYRTNNDIKYTSPSWAGFRVEATYAPGGVAGDYTRNQNFSAGASYLNGPLTTGVAYVNVRNPNVGYFGANSQTTLTAATSNVSAGTPVYSGFASAHTYQNIAAAIAYQFGAATIGGTYANVRFSGLGDASSGPNTTGYRGNAVFNSAEVSLRYQITPALLVGAAYNYTHGGSADFVGGSKEAATYHQGALGIDYFLSKRTDLYLIGVYQRALGTDSTNHSAVAAINGLSASDNGRQAALRLGLRSKF